MKGFHDERYAWGGGVVGVETFWSCSKRAILNRRQTIEMGEFIAHFGSSDRVT
jgi:hypothetical protein